jgi:hypothetical protein
MATGRAAELFADARALHDAALDRLDASDIRDAAEKAWCATKRAADGLIVARTGEEPDRASDTTRGLRHLGVDDEDIHRSMNHYYAAREALHGCCFYRASCELIEDTERLIHETVGYIDEVELLAAA